MIKVGNFFYIHYTTILFFVICWFTRHLELIFLSYFSVFLHEMAHTFTAYLIGIEPSYIAFFPFGVNLRVKRKIIYSVSDEILLYMSGPLLNALLALFIQLIFTKTAYFQYFYWNNIGLFLFNLLPILPMDGAMVLKRILSDRIGSKYAGKILNVISIIMIFFLTTFEVFFAVKSGFNFTIIFVIIFLTANIFTNNEKYGMNFVKELIYIKEKSKKSCIKVVPFLVDDDYSERKLAENFNASKNYLIFKKNKQGKISEILSEEEVIDRVLNNIKKTPHIH